MSTTSTYFFENCNKIRMERMFPIVERELYIVKGLEELEKSYKGPKVTSEEEELKAYLDVNFDIEKFKELAILIKKALDGPLGDYFFENRKDFLIKLAFYVWKKYIVSAIHQIDILYELRLTEELTNEEFRKYEVILAPAKVSFLDMLEALSKILMKSENIDIIWLIKTSINVLFWLIRDRY
jgi:hypothetical protein